MKLVIIANFTLTVFISALSSEPKLQKQTLPSVNVKTLDGKTVNIQDYGKTGKISILFFWETTCKPSAKALDNILDVYDEWQAKYKCDLIAISIDDSRNNAKIKPFVNGKGWPYIILLDENMDLARAMNVANCPFIFIIDKLGNIVYKHYGYVEGIELEIEEEMKKH